MNDEQLAAWLAQHGGEVGRKNNEKTIDGPADPTTGQPTKQVVIDSTTITAKDGATVTLRRTPGPINGGNDYEVIENEPPKPAATTGTSTATPRVPAGSVPRIEGTPDPSKPGGRDNTQPIRAWHAPDGSVVYEALTPAERLQWEREKNGGLTDAEAREQTGESRTDVPNRPGWTKITRKKVQGGNTTEVTVYVGPDGKEVSTLPPETGTVRVPVDGHPGIYLVTTTTAGAGGKTQAAHYENESGQRVPQPAAAPSYTVAQRTVNGQTYTVITKTPKDGSPPTITNYGPDGKPMAGAIPAEGSVQVPEDAPTIDTSSPERAHASFLQLYQWVDAKVRSGAYNQVQAKTILEGPHQAVKLVLDREATERARQQQETANRLTERGQDITQTGGRLSAATSGFATSLADAEKTNLLAGPGINAAASTLLGNLVLSKIHGEQMGGMATPASVVPGPVASLPSYRPALPAPSSVGAALPGGSAIGPVSAGVTATNAAAINPTAGNVQAANDAVMSGSRAAFGALGVPPPSPAAPPPLAGQARDDWRLNPGAPPTAMSDPSAYGMPTMALAGSMSGQNPYGSALDSLRALGIGDDDIDEALRSFMGGVA